MRVSYVGPLDRRRPERETPMNIVSRIVSTLLLGSLVVVFAVGAAVATPVDGLESRYASGEQSVATSSALDGLESRYATTMRTRGGRSRPPRSGTKACVSSRVRTSTWTWSRWGRGAS